MCNDILNLNVDKHDQGMRTLFVRQNSLNNDVGYQNIVYIHILNHTNLHACLSEFSCTKSVLKCTNFHLVGCRVENATLS